MTIHVTEAEAKAWGIVDPGPPASPKKKRSKVPKKKPYPQFERMCQEFGLPVPVREHRFHETRQWRFDFAFLGAMVAVEIEGGAFSKVKGRHSRGAGFREDLVKYAEANCLGWVVLRVMPEQVKSNQVFAWLKRIIHVRQSDASRGVRVPVVDPAT